LRRFAFVVDFLTIESEGDLQRLFSTFANGWPGIGLLLQRILTAILLIRFGIIDLTGSSFSLFMAPRIMGGCLGILLLIGIWTPIVGAFIALIELWVVVTHVGDLWMQIVVAVLGATAAMIGPGAWSLDARLFGRKHIENIRHKI
jgi:putative oxidoreductase